MAEEIDESGFYRQDFSTVSDWEVFNAQLGEVFQKLSINDDEYTRKVDSADGLHFFSEVRREILLVYNSTISVDYYFPIKSDRLNDITCETGDTIFSMYNDLMSAKSTFGPPLLLGSSHNLHTISCMFGLKRFVLIHPHQSNEKYFSNPSEFCFFLSAATVVAAEYCPNVPIFVQIYDPKWNSFLGVGMHSSLRTNFDLVALNRSPIECRYLSGLLSIFKEKQPANSSHSIMVSVRNTYALQTLHVRFEMSVPFFKSLSEIADDKVKSGSLKSKNFIALPCGYFPDSATEVYIVCSWLETSENIIDSPLHSEFVPSKCTNCSMYQKVHADSYLSSCLRDFSKLSCNKDLLETYVGSTVYENVGGAHIANALQHLTDSHFGNFRSNDSNYSDTSNIQKTRIKVAGPVNETELKEFLAYLFPDLYPAFTKYTYTNDGPQTSEQFDPHRIKSSPFDSLSLRLSCLIATCNAHFGGKSGMAQVWVAFIRELRFIWSVRLSIPGVATGFPDTRTCLLNQKLQMLNYCIERSKFRKYGNQSYEHTIVKYSEIDGHNFEEAFDEIGDDDEDEFYDCSEFAPEGRDRRLGDLKLLDCEEPLYIPITQDPVPKTEDELQADAETMLKFGPGSDKTMQIMCSSLLSDMEAFKAANPKAKLEDFIRWYSPKDWEEDEHFRTGKLSSRMQAPGNTWQTIWHEAQPVPAFKQRRLFDETTEALKVLSYLETRNISEIYELVIVSLLHAAIQKLKDILETADVIDIFETQIEALFADLCYLSRDVEILGQHDSTFEHKTPSPEHIIEKLELLEVQFYQFKCFEHLTDSPDRISFHEIKKKFSEMIKNDNCCTIRNSEKVDKHVGGFNEDALISLGLGNELQNNLIIKEYVLRLRGETIFGPQFLRAIVKGEEVRLCGAFTENTTLI